MVRACPWYKEDKDGPMAPMQCLFNKNKAVNFVEKASASNVNLKTLRSDELQLHTSDAWDVWLADGKVTINEEKCKPDPGFIHEVQYEGLTNPSHNNHSYVRTSNGFLACPTQDWGSSLHLGNAPRPQQHKIEIDIKVHAPHGEGAPFQLICARLGPLALCNKIPKSLR